MIIYTVMTFPTHPPIIYSYNVLRTTETNYLTKNKRIKREDGYKNIIEVIEKWREIMLKEKDQLLKRLQEYEKLLMQSPVIRESKDFNE